MKLSPILFACLVLASCSSASAIPADDAGEMSGGSSLEQSAFLYVDPAMVESQRAAFLAKLKALGPTSKGKFPLYQEYVPVIGANGVLEGIESLWPKCHSEGHDLGKVIYDSVKDVGTALRVCRDGCYSGCMHGVLMEAFTAARGSAADDEEQHVDIDILTSMIDEICKEKTMVDSYSPGDCAHAVGHAMMVLSDYAVTDAIGYCDKFAEEHMRYYCATGAYMEYVTERDTDDVASKKRPLYPCDAGEYPSACARYKMVHVIPRFVKKKSDIAKFVRSCDQLKGEYRLGCYHGSGNGFMGAIAQGVVTLEEVCGEGTGDARFVCIEGAMERMAKYHPERAAEVCAVVTDAADRKTCDDSVARGMYDMTKDLTLYTRTYPAENSQASPKGSQK